VDKIEGESIVEFSGLNEAISIDLSKCKLSGEETETSVWVLSSRTTDWFCIAISMELEC